MIAVINALVVGYDQNRMHLSGNVGSGDIFTSLSSENTQTESKTESKNEFNPYVDNGGSLIAIAGLNYSIIACDTRLSEGYYIRSRNVSRIYDLDGTTLLCGCGCFSDLIGLTKELQFQTKEHLRLSKSRLTASGIAYLLSSTLYSRRTFPFYSFCCIGGLDKQGHGCTYRFDAVGSFERAKCICLGTGEKLMQPFLDDLTNMDQDNSLWIKKLSSDAFESLEECYVDLTEEQAIDVVVKAFNAASERDIKIGDGIHICTVSYGSDEESNDLSNVTVRSPLLKKIQFKSRYVTLPTH